MPKRKWRTVSCVDDGLCSHGSQPAAYRWVADRERGVRYRVQYDDGLGGGWCPYATVAAAGDGTTEED
jgi:hypothetical protein